MIGPMLLMLSSLLLLFSGSMVVGQVLHIARQMLRTDAPKTGSLHLLAYSVMHSGGSGMPLHDDRDADASVPLPVVFAVVFTVLVVVVLVVVVVTEDVVKEVVV